MIWLRLPPPLLDRIGKSYLLHREKKDGGGHGDCVRGHGEERERSQIRRQEKSLALFQISKEQDLRRILRMEGFDLD
jgi:hypothetical protein